MNLLLSYPLSGKHIPLRATSNSQCGIKIIYSTTFVFIYTHKHNVLVMGNVLFDQERRSSGMARLLSVELIKHFF